MQTHAAYLSRHLHQHGYRIEVFTHRLSDPQMSQETADYDAAQPFPVHRILGRLSYQHNLQLLSQHIRRFSPDLIYTSTVYYGILQQRAGIPVVCRCVGNDVLRPWLGYPFQFGSRLLNNPHLEKLLHRWLERHTYPDWVELLFRRQRERITKAAAHAASHIFANSAFTAGLLQAIQVPQERIQILVGGVDSQRFHMPDACKISARRALGLPESGVLLMTACRLVAKKGVDLLLDALPALRATLPLAHLVIVGDGKYRARFEQYCAAQGIDNVIFTGRVSHDMIHRYYTACDMFLLASRESVNASTGTRDVETMGRVLCEANAAGIPVIASRSGGIPSVITDGVNGLLFEAENLEQLIDRINYLHGHPQARSEMIRQGLLRARDEFDWASILHAHRQAFHNSHIFQHRPIG
ncbi:glycosyltransferase family 4 protein [Janthinobacterium sp. 17J80-10]|uniref:glycosyltransferase family 4 protein n=1 Tax=Janthinobacterium sp. 17J80-10 TaxID=2497863 RepID=UPI0010058A70|nr:glycosyltransferase family 4 protein [Janthinobacterium sp. 17J80-10]QAU34930.1 glycosyltransferase family 1 protein [Janthinobacterium sp. 17J80-10]